MMTEAKVETCYVTLVGALVQAKCHVIRAGAQHGLTPAQSLTLLLMPPEVLLTMHEVSVRMGCDASNATGLVDGLEEKAFIAREEKPGDRRTKMVRLLPEGQRARQEIVKELAAKSELFQKLPSAELDILVALLQKAIA